MPSHVNAERAFNELLVRRAQWVSDPADINYSYWLNIQIRDLETWIIERTDHRMLTTRSYLIGLVHVVAFAPFASEIYNYSQQELLVEMRELDEHVAPDSFVARLRSQGLAPEPVR
jgi:hypothetical protein